MSMPQFCPQCDGGCFCWFDEYDLYKYNPRRVLLGDVLGDELPEQVDQTVDQPSDTTNPGDDLDVCEIGPFGWVTREDVMGLSSRSDNA